VQVYGEIEVVPPYGVDDCAFLEGASRNAMMMERVATVLKTQRERQSATGGEAPEA
jgi:hypothetical protein